MSILRPLHKVTTAVRVQMSRIVLGAGGNTLVIPDMAARNTASTSGRGVSSLGSGCAVTREEGKLPDVPHRATPSQRGNGSSSLNSRGLSATIGCRSRHARAGRKRTSCWGPSWLVSAACVVKKMCNAQF